ncbi:MAG: hypothetical protein EBS86_13715 [Crocinitomicaceae bacterium]|nr:hypothetical protein [Crocinitomicaceae bacterium]
MYSDVVQTYCFGFNKSKISVSDETILQKMVQGFIWKHPVIDFFDPISFHIIENGGRVKILDNQIIGGVDKTGGRMNSYEENKLFDVGDKIIHFAGVGSGRNFYNMIKNRKQINVPKPYVDFGLKRYNIYSQIFFGKTILDREHSYIENIQPLINDVPNILYINLKERIDRKEQMEESLKNFKFTRINAIRHIKGLSGCVQSHIYCIEYAKANNFPYVIIFEDDLEWTVPIEYVKKIFNILPHIDFDVAVLCPVFSKGNPVCVNDYFVRGCESQTTLCYVCKNHYYDTLLENFKQGYKLLEETNIDDLYALDQYWKVLQRKDNWIFAYPNLGKQRPGYSNIQNKNVNYDLAYGRNFQLS